MDLKHTTLVIFFRYDNELRIENLSTILEFYAAECQFAEIIIVHEQRTPWRTSVDTTLAILADRFDATLVTYKGGDQWNKSKGYNRAIKLASTECLVFNDTDVVVDPAQLEVAEHQIISNTTTGLVYPFDGTFLCVDRELRDTFIETLSIDTLKKFQPETNDLSARTKHVTVGHNNSPGGIVCGRRDNLIAARGYNPDFIGWGYEDSEILTRIPKLGYQVLRVDGPCWHLDHTDNNSSPKETQPYHHHNRNVANHVDRLDRNGLLDYIKTWKL